MEKKIKITLTEIEVIFLHKLLDGGLEITDSIDQSKVFQSIKSKLLESKQ